MSLDALLARLPDYARDLRMNLSTLATEPSLTVQQRAGTFVASALATRHAALTRAVCATFGPQLSPDALAAAQAAAAIMAMNNVYYRFTHEVGGDYPAMPPRLRMAVMAKPGVEKADFELWSLAVSAINGCGMCMQAHDNVVREHGVTREQVQSAVRIASVVHAVGAVLDGEDALEA